MNVSIDDELLEKARANLPHFFLQRTDDAAIEMMIRDAFFQNCIEGFDTDPLGNAKSCYVFKRFLRENGLKKGDRLTVINIKNMKKLNVEIGFAQGDRLLSEVSRKVREVTEGDFFRLASGDKYIAFSHQINEKGLKLPVTYEIIKIETKKATEEKDWMFINPETNHDFILNAIVIGENEYFKVLSKGVVA